MKNFYCLLIFLIGSLGVAQHNLDLLNYEAEKEYTQEFLDSLSYDYILGEQIGRVRMSVLKKVLENNPEKKGWIRYYIGMSTLVYDEQKLDSALYFSNKAIDHYYAAKIKRPIDESLLIAAYLTKGSTLRIQRKYEESIVIYQKALDLTKKYPYRLKGYLLEGIAGNHYELGRDEVALNLYLDLEKDTIHLSTSRSASVTYTNISNIYNDRMKYEKAKKYLQKAINVGENSNFKINLPIGYGTLGSLFYNTGDKDSTAYYYKKAIETAETYELENPYTGFKEDQLYYKSYLDVESGYFKRAIERLTQIIENFKDFDVIQKEDRSLLRSVQYLLATIYEKTNQFKAYGNLTTSIYDLLERSYKDQSKVNLDNLEQKYQSEQKDASISQLEETTKSQQIVLEQRNTINWILGGLLLAFVGLGFLFYKQRQLQNKYKASNLEQRLLRSQLNPHFLFNALNTLRGLVQKNSVQTIPYISKLASLLRSILENSREEFISMQEEFTTIEDYLELQSNFSRKFEYDIRIDTSINTEEVLIPPMFIQPFIENAIAHGFIGDTNEKIIIKVTQSTKDSILHFSIDDNGIGYTKALQKKETTSGYTSLSGTILQERLSLYAKAYKSKAFYKIKDLSKGTRVDLYLPYLLDV